MSDPIVSPLQEEQQVLVLDHEKVKAAHAFIAGWQAALAWQQGEGDDEPLKAIYAPLKAYLSERGRA